MLSKKFRRFWCDQSGATAIEYGLICAFVFLAFAATMPFVAQEVVNMFELIQNTWNQAVQ